MSNVAGTDAVEQPLIAQLRDFLRRRHGTAAVEVLDQRLEDGEVKNLVGKPRLETSYRLKQTVQAIKQAAEEWSHDEPELLSMIRRAMASEAEGGFDDRVAVLRQGVRLTPSGMEWRPWTNRILIHSWAFKTNALANLLQAFFRRGVFFERVPFPSHWHSVVKLAADNVFPPGGVRLEGRRSPV